MCPLPPSPQACALIGNWIVADWFIGWCSITEPPQVGYLQILKPLCLFWALNLVKIKKYNKSIWYTKYNTSQYSGNQLTRKLTRFLSSVQLPTPSSWGLSPTFSFFAIINWNMNQVLSLLSINILNIDIKLQRISNISLCIPVDWFPERMPHFRDNCHKAKCLKTGILKLDHIPDPEFHTHRSSTSFFILKWG